MWYTIACPRRYTELSRVCYVCGKGPQKGHQVSHSDRKSRRWWYPNLQTVTIQEKGTRKRVKVCAKCLKSSKVTRAA